MSPPEHIAPGIRYLCLRFDVDTYLCAREGVPNLLALANAHDVRFTFFFNMGRSISRRHYLKRRIGPRPEHPAEGGGNKLSVLDKLGLPGFLLTAVVNPWVGRGNPGVVKAAADQGHEIGLHGGRNHGAWMAEGADWSEAALEGEVHWGLEALRRAGVNDVTSFSSPGWRGSDRLNRVLARLGMRLVADEHGPGGDLHRLERQLYTVPTRLSGEPGGIGYLEHKRAQGLSDSAIEAEFRCELASAGQFAVLYDHPCYAGIRERVLIGRLIVVAQELGYRLVTMGALPRLVGES